MKTKPVKLNTAQKWNELTRKQLFFIAKLFVTRVPEEHALFRILMYLTGIKVLKKNILQGGMQYFRFRKGRKKFLLSAEQVSIMINSLRWLVAESELTKNPLPVFRIWFKKFYGPADNLYNITLREFIFAEMNFMSFCQSQHVVYLNNIIAILWRKQVKPYKPDAPDYGGDRRERFNDSNFPARSRKLIWLKLNKKYALFNFYAGCRSAMQKEFPRVFIADGGTAKPINMAKQMMDLVRAVNGGDPTKNEQLLEINVRDILGEMESAHEKVAEMKRRTKK